jgi:hypothetical protein
MARRKPQTYWKEMIVNVIQRMICMTLLLAGGVTVWAVPTMEVGEYAQEISVTTTDRAVHDLVMDGNGVVWGATENGVLSFENGAWTPAKGLPHAAVACLGHADGALVSVMADGAVFALEYGSFTEQSVSAPENMTAMAATMQGVFGVANGKVYSADLGGSTAQAVDGLNALIGDGVAVDVAANPQGDVAVAATTGLFLSRSGGEWQALYPANDSYSWAPRDVRAVAFDLEGGLWFAASNGVGCLKDGDWSLYTGAEGLPYNDFTTIAVGEDGSMWFGTTLGAIRFDGQAWSYRQGRRWVIDDKISSIVVDEDGHALLATAKGVSRIERKAMTLAEKAAFFESEIDQYHRRTEHGFVLDVGVSEPGEKKGVKKHDSDNDGLWTSMYGAGECFAYAATGDPKARERAKAAFDAMKFLNDVTQGGEAPAPVGFVARTVLPTSGPNPNDRDNPLHDMKNQLGDRKWKVVRPRWPRSEDGKWFWKSDTSSDELDGHYFLYALYYDLVADTMEEKARVRDHVRALTDHLVINDFCLVDHDGQPTRWGVFSPEALNHDSAWWADRGINSLTMLTFLSVAEHVTGDTKYRALKKRLIDEESYAQNLQFAKWHRGPGTGNQSDDEMAFMNFYHLIKYEKDQDLKEFFTYSFYRYWRNERPECSPLFNFLFNAISEGVEYTDIWGTTKVYPQDSEWLVDSVDYLKGYAWDRFSWRHQNSHRLDVTHLPKFVYGYDEDEAVAKGHRKRGYSTTTGKVLPIAERYTGHWNHNPWTLDGGGNGTGLTDGAAYLLPYYMGLHHGFIQEAK